MGIDLSGEKNTDELGSLPSVSDHDLSLSFLIHKMVRIFNYAQFKC